MGFWVHKFPKDYLQTVRCNLLAGVLSATTVDNVIGCNLLVAVLSATTARQHTKPTEEMRVDRVTICDCKLVAVWCDSSTAVWCDPSVTVLCLESHMKVSCGRQT